MSLRIVIVEDHEVSRIALKLTLESGGEFKVVAEATDCASGVDRVQCEMPDLVVTELFVGQSGEFDMLRRIKDLSPEICICVITAHESEEYAAHALVAGADGICSKDIPQSELLQIVRLIGQGEWSFDARQLRRAFGFGEREDLDHQAPECVTMLLSGKSLSEIAEAIGCSKSELKVNLREACRELLSNHHGAGHSGG